MVKSIQSKVAAAAFAIAMLALPVAASAPAPTQQQSKFEIRFMENMIDHHMMAVMMSQICLQKAVHPELQPMCQSIITTQSAQIQTMQSWLAQWYGVTYSPQTSNARMEKLMKLNGAEFEIEFMQEMIEHHADAIRESTDCLLKAYHKELRDLCQNIITAQAAEINTMRTWLCQWYGECDAV
ncbi:MAG TPA: DUF305 domain-containing protein [Terriglobales bacterium]|nr:DUF305 domain-containing protein [Terriglobales bacterium]